MPGSPFAPFPYFEGPSDAGELRNYLNQLIRYVNMMSGSWLQSQFRKIISTGPGDVQQVEKTDEWIDVDASLGDITLVLPSYGDVLGQKFLIRKTDATFGNDVSFTGTMLQPVVLSMPNQMVWLGATESGYGTLAGPF